MSKRSDHYSPNGNEEPKKLQACPREHAMKKAADDLTDALLTLVEPLQTFLLAVLVKRNEISMRDLTRSLILSRSGEGFEPAVQHAIRCYREAFEEIIRVEDNKALDNVNRKDILAGFTRLLAKHAEDLEFLGVEVLRVEPNDALDLSIHQVVKRLPAENKRQVGTVKRCVAPGFRWMSVNWVERIEHAEVWAYTECREERRRTSAQTKDRDFLSDQLYLS